MPFYHGGKRLKSKKRPRPGGRKSSILNSARTPNLVKSSRQ